MIVLRTAENDYTISGVVEAWALLRELESLGAPAHDILSLEDGFTAGDEELTSDEINIIVTSAKSLDNELHDRLSHESDAVLHTIKEIA